MITDERIDNICLIDVRMFGFTGWASAYLVAGEKKVALIDTGPASSAEIVHAGILKHGFALKDITHIFISHIHLDHVGSAGILLKEMPDATVFVHPKVAKHVIDPSIMMDNMKREGGGKMAARFGELLPVDSSRVRALSDGEVFDLGNGEKLKTIFTPGHATSGISIIEEKNSGIFVGDTPGIYLAKENVVIIPSPFGSDLKQAMQSLKTLMGIPAKLFFYGHFGFCDKPKELLEVSLKKMERYWDIAAKTMEENKTEEVIINRIIVENSAAVEVFKQRNDGLYEYFTEELIPMWARGFAKYYMKQRQG
jgi:glyoxylase-like metal-dependent hydrolase (beta-lactamase superfamily II)